MISDEYKKQITSLHRKSFGSGKDLHEEVVRILESENIETLLDFGCGKGIISNLIKEKYPKIKVYSYDPVTSPIELPKSVDMVFSSDVLEHVEPEYIDETLDMLFKIATKIQYHLIACSPAKKTLSDGRNAHLIIESPEWWKNKLKNYDWQCAFEEIIERDVQRKNDVLHVIKYITVLQNR